VRRGGDGVPRSRAPHLRGGYTIHGLRRFLASVMGVEGEMRWMSRANESCNGARGQVRYSPRLA
jgi:hypothetical protein